VRLGRAIVSAGLLLSGVPARSPKSLDSEA